MLLNFITKQYTKLKPLEINDETLTKDITKNKTY